MTTQRFNTVWYLPQENKDRYLNILAGRVTGKLTLGANSIQFSSGKESVVITNILRVTLGKQGSDFINDWVKIEYGQSANPAVAFFADGSFFGWGGLFGGTQRIFAAVNRRGTANLEDHAAHAVEPQNSSFERPRMAAPRGRVQRPAGVTLVSLFDFLVALIGVLLGVLVFLAIATGDPGIFPREFVTGLGAVLAMVVFFFAAVAAFVGWGIWKVKKWAYVVQIIFAVLDLMFSLSTALLVVGQFKVWGVLVALIRTGIDLLIVRYLLRPQVKAAFWPLPLPGAPAAKPYRLLPPEDLR